MIKHFIGISILGTLAAAAFTPTPIPARLIAIDVLVDGKVVLEGSTSDDGRQDVDAVWRTAVQRIEKRRTILRETENFRKESLTKGNDGRYTLASANKKSKVTVRVRYGGQAQVRRLNLTRIEDPKTPRGDNPHKWCLDAAQLKQLFASRLIKRSDAAGLNDVKGLTFQTTETTGSR